MSGLIGNADVLENHLLVVAQQRERTSDLILQLRANLGRLGEAWQDSKFSRFEEDMNSALLKLEKFCSICESISPDLQKDIDVIRRYLKT